MKITQNDQAHRERILADLTTNMLVEAGAGSGKTTSLVGRMVNHIRSGTPVERIAAVTFTRKAANELRERFRNELEGELQASQADAVSSQRFAQALHDLDRSFLGTIHSFCGRILREHPLEAGLDPTFTEVSGEEMKQMESNFWRRWIDRQERNGSAVIQAVRAAGIDPVQLLQGFVTVRTYPDVRFEAVERELPATNQVRCSLEALMDQAHRLRPSEQPASGWDKLMSLTRHLERDRNVDDWNNPVAFFRSLERVKSSLCEPTQNRWSATKEGKAAAKALGQSFLSLAEGEIRDLVTAWREYRYPLVMRVLQAAASDFQQERHATGRLGFEDLLSLTAQLLRNHPVIRGELGEKYASLLVDEFQDTDPIQAEVCFLLASNPSEGNDWRGVTPRAGSLFVVGDPKQCIYRFRRADIGVYEFVKQRLAACGVVLSLTSNFRSANAIATTVNAHFETAFGVDPTPQQAAYSPMVPINDHVSAAVSYYRLSIIGSATKKDRICQYDATMVASFIASRIEANTAKPDDFLILTRAKAPVSSYARALALQNVPCTTTGANFPQERELKELLVVLRAIGDPDNSVFVVAALEGMFCGLSVADLWEAKRSGLRFAISHRPSDDVTRTGQALRQLHDWWIVSQRQPVDVLLERILDDTGLLFHATSEMLGDARAGALLHLVEKIRAGSTTGFGSVTAAVESIDALLLESLDDISLRSGRGDAVRVMNVHQAKGLEAAIVILAAPIDESDHPPRVQITRTDAGDAHGGLCIGYSEGQVFVPLAQCADWDAMQLIETKFQVAEEARLLYVAATRAKRELVVAQFEERQKFKTKVDQSVWRPLAPTLERTGNLIEIMPREAQKRQAVRRSAESIQQQVQHTQNAVQALAAASFTVQTVTQSAKQGESDQPYVLRKGGAGKGASWGRAVHAVIEAFLRGRRDSNLTAFAAGVARSERLTGTLAAELLTFAARTGAGDKWQLPVPFNGEIRTELSVMKYETRDGSGVFTEGVIDAAVLQDDEWQVLDWKTDAVDESEWSRRQPKYQKQVEAYAEMLSALSGRPAVPSVHRIE